MRAVSGDVGEWVVCVDGSPVFDGGAIVQERVGGLGGGAWREIKPLASAAVEVLENRSVAFRVWTSA